MVSVHREAVTSPNDPVQTAFWILDLTPVRPARPSDASRGLRSENLALKGDACEQMLHDAGGRISVQRQKYLDNVAQ